MTFASVLGMSAHAVRGLGMSLHGLRDALGSRTSMDRDWSP